MTDRIWKRLLDKTELTKWWSASESCLEFDSEEEWRQQHNETSQTIRRVMLTLIVYSFFCLLSLGASDSSLVGSSAKIKIPFAETEIKFWTFLYIGPLVLISLTWYLQIFIEYKRILDMSYKRPRLPYLFNLKSVSAQELSKLIFFWLSPGVLVVFSYKASSHNSSAVIVMLTIMTALWMLWVRIKYVSGVVSRVLFRTTWFVLVVIVFVKFDVIRSELFPKRELYLFRSDLKGRDLRDTDLTGGYLREANLEGANLEGANLSESDMYNAILRKAYLVNADLERADLSRADLDQATLYWASLKQAKLERSNLEKAKLYGVNLYGADLTKVIGLTQEQLDISCVDTTTVLPDSLKIPSNPLEKCNVWNQN